MNDFSELEAELKKLRPVAVSNELTARIERALSEQPVASAPTSAVISRRKPFQINWRILGLGLATAAALLVLAKVGENRPVQKQERVATSLPATPPQRNATASAGRFIPTGMTQVVYNTRNEGLVFTKGSENPVRRMRYRTRETLQWRQSETGASLRVSYPSEEVVLLPVSGQ